MFLLKGIERFYKTKLGRLYALKATDLSLPSTSLVLLSGKSGSGKTTLLNIVGGMDLPSKGNIIFDEEVITAKNVDDYRAENVGFVFQEYNLINSMTVKENLALAFDTVRKKPTSPDFQFCLGMVGLPDKNESIETLLNRKPMELSGGQRQRIAIARALIKNPSILVLDEPTGALDEENSIALLKLLKELSSERLVLLSSHDVSLAKGYADRVIQISEGTVIKDEILTPAPPNTGKQPQNRNNRLSFSSLWKAAIRGLAGSKVRLVTSVMLSFLVCSAFGITLSANTADSEKVAIRTQYEQSNQRCFFLLPKREQINIPSDQETEIVNGFIAGQEQALSDYLGSQKPISICETGSFLSKNSTIGRTSLNDENPYLRFICTGFDYAIEIDTSGDLEAMGLSKDLRFENPSICRMPESFDEVALTDIQADLLLKRGYYDSESQQNCFFSSIDELIGKRIGTLTVTGIYETEESLSYWAQLDISHYSSTYGYDTEDMYLASGYCQAKYMIVKDGFATAKGKSHSMAMLPLSGSLNNELNLRKAMAYEDNNTRYSASLLGRYSGFTSTIDYINHLLSSIVYSIIGVLSVISGILSLNLFYTNVKKMEKELGILRAIGANKQSILAIVFIQGGIIGLCEYVLAVIVALVGIAIINNQLSISILELSFTCLLLMLLLVFVIMSLVLLVASNKATRQKPINVIEMKNS